MALREIREIGVWALATALLTAGVLGARSADSAGPLPAANQPAAQIDGCTVTASVAASSRPYEVDVAVRATNPANDARTCRVRLALVRQEFSGNPLSRVPGAGDYKRTIEGSVEVLLEVPCGASAEKTITLPIQARPTAGSAGNALLANLDATPRLGLPTNRRAVAVNAPAASAVVVRSLLANAGPGWAAQATSTQSPIAQNAAVTAPAQAPAARLQMLAARTPAQNAVLANSQVPVLQNVAFTPRSRVPARNTAFPNSQVSVVQSEAFLPRSQALAMQLANAQPAQGGPTRAVGFGARFAPIYAIEVTPRGAARPVALASFAANLAWPKP